MKASDPGWNNLRLLAKEKLVDKSHSLTPKTTIDGALPVVNLM
jgi:hypothetical protein